MQTLQPPNSTAAGSQKCLALSTVLSISINAPFINMSFSHHIIESHWLLNSSALLLSSSCKNYLVSVLLICLKLLKPLIMISHLSFVFGSYGIALKLINYERGLGE